MGSAGMRGKKKLLAQLLHSTGTLSLLPHMPAWRGQQVRILTYHRVFDVADESVFPYDPGLISASTTDFREQIEYVATHFVPVTFARVLAALDDDRPLPHRAVVVTFDDGHADTYTNAYPILRSFDVPAAVFLSTGYIGGKEVFWFDRISYILFHASAGMLEMPGLNQTFRLTDVPSRRRAAEIILEHLKSLSDEQRRERIDWLVGVLGVETRADDAALSGPMTWDQVREMARAGIEFGSHAVSHPMLTRIDDATLDRELAESRIAIENQVGRSINIIAYPEGGPDAFDARVIAAAQRAGYRLGLSYMPGPNYLKHLNRFAIPRLQVERNTSRAWFRAMLELPGLFALEMGDTIPAQSFSDRNAEDPTATSPSMTATSFGMVEAEDSNGWHVLLGANLTGTMLCVDFAPAAPSAFFRLLGGAVHSIDLSFRQGHAQPEKIAELCRLLESNWLVRDGAATIDAFVLHDLEGRILSSHDEINLGRLLQLVYLLLKPGGFCYLGFRNGGALLGAGDGERAQDPPRLATVRKLLVHAGFRRDATRVHPYLLARGCVSEVLPERGYTSVKNSKLWREHVKEWCYGRFGAIRWAPAYGIVAFKDAVTPTLVDRLAQRLQLIPEFASTQLVMTRCQLLWRKVILSFGSAADKYGRLVVIYTRDKQAIGRREAEAGILGKMESRVPALRDKLPRVVAQGDLAGYRYFVLSEFPGMTIDRACPGTEIATRNAVHFLSELHKATAERCTGSQAVVDELIGNLFELAIDRYPALAPEIAQLAETVRRRAIGRHWLAVWQHGDYKLENVILNPHSLALVGVIDWELSRIRGLPMLDMLYLIAYNRSVNSGVRISDVYRSVILPWKFSAEEIQMLDAYQASIGLVVTDPALWATLYMIHDVGVRYSFNLAWSDERERLEQLLRETAAMLDLRPVTAIVPFGGAAVDGAGP